MGDFQKVSAALTGMKLDASPGSGSGGKGGSANRSPSTSKDDSVDHHGYAVPRDTVVVVPEASPSTPLSAGVAARVPVMVADATTGNEYAQPIALASAGKGNAPPPPPPPNPDKSKAKQLRERREQMALQNGG